MLENTQTNPRSPSESSAVRELYDPEGQLLLMKASSHMDYSRLDHSITVALIFAFLF